MTNLYCAWLILTAFSWNCVESGGRGNPSQEPSQSRVDSVSHFSIKVYEHNSAYAYSREVAVNDSLIEVSFVGGLVGENSKHLWSAPLHSDTVQRLDSLLTGMGLDSLKRVYRNSEIVDGMEFGFLIERHGKITRTQVMNCWVPPLLGLVNFLNGLLPNEYKMDTRLPKKF